MASFPTPRKEHLTAKEAGCEHSHYSTTRSGTHPTSSLSKCSMNPVGRFANQAMLAGLHSSLKGMGKDAEGLLH